MPEVMLIDAVRSPIGRRNGGLSTVHPAELLGQVQRALVERTGIRPQDVGQVVGGCVTQVGEQHLNVTRTAWLSAGLPISVPASTVDAQCGSSQQAAALAAGQVALGSARAVIACGVESMSRLPIGSAVSGDLGHPIPDDYRERYEPTSQFEGAERLAERWGITRPDADAFGLLSQERAHQAWERGAFDAQVVAIDAPEPAGEGSGTRTRVRVARDEGLRQTSLEALATLRAVVPPDGVHTAGTSSQISDGAAAVLMANREAADELGLAPRARVVDSCLVGTDPEIMLTGPIDATRLLLQRNGLTIDEIDIVEINEAFASVVLAWQRELGADLSRVNPNGGAIALGHPLGATGAVLITKALHELERTDGKLALITMCCYGGLGTGMLIERAP